jgi:hypothetical protein
MGIAFFGGWLQFCHMLYGFVVRLFDGWEKVPSNSSLQKIS